MNYQVNIGLEVHVELFTKTKLFCGCSTQFGAPPNTQVCPICLGLPGVLPVINKEAVKDTVITALALDCKISEFCRFSRKNYYYPDLPKNYQISQYDEPLAKNGYLKIVLNGKEKKIRIERIHLEEDAGKLIHGTNPEDAEFSFVDYNRVGIPLMEIVSHPDISSPEETYEYLVKLRKILRYLRVSDCNMEEGSLRCDANISLNLPGEKMGTKIELKNINSFKEIKDGLFAEMKRQSYLLSKGEKIVQETRLWNTKKKKTISMRGKEGAQDYRYFPEPDLLPIEISKEWEKSLRASLPELPQKRYQRFIQEYSLPEYDAGIITDSREISDYFEKCVKYYPHPKIVSNWIMGEILRLLKEENKSIEEIKVTPEKMGELLKEVEKGVISGNLAKNVLAKMFKTGKSALQIIQEQDLRQLSDKEELKKIIKEAIKENSEAVESFRKGKKKAVGFLMGQVMKKTQGRANPRLVNNFLKKELEKVE